MCGRRRIEMGIPCQRTKETAADRFISVDDFARLARLSRRTIDRYRQDRPLGFPREYDVSRGKVARPRFKLADVLAWMETRALW